MKWKVFHFNITIHIKRRVYFNPTLSMSSTLPKEKKSYTCSISFNHDRSKQ